MIACAVMIQRAAGDFRLHIISLNCNAHDTLNCLMIRQVEYVRDIGNDWCPIMQLTEQPQ